MPNYRPSLSGTSNLHTFAAVGSTQNVTVFARSDDVIADIQPLAETWNIASLVITTLWTPSSCSPIRYLVGAYPHYPLAGSACFSRAPADSSIFYFSFFLNQFLFALFFKNFFTTWRGHDYQSFVSIDFDIIIWWALHKRRPRTKTGNWFWFIHEFHTIMIFIHCHVAHHVSATLLIFIFLWLSLSLFHAHLAGGCYNNLYEIIIRTECVIINYIKILIW